MMKEYWNQLLAKEEEVRNYTKQLMDRSKEKDDVEYMSEEEFEEKKCSYGLATALIEENTFLCRIIYEIAENQEIILEKLKKLEKQG